MKNEKFVIGLLGFCFAAAMVGCDQTPPPAGKAPAADAPAADAPAAVVMAAKVDHVPLTDLQAGLQTMLPRISAKEQAYNEIVPVANNSRLFMHPLIDKDAMVEFDTTGLTAVTLSPYIEDLSNSADCHNNPEAGTVAFTYAIDSGAPVKVAVDRNYKSLVTVDLTGASKLTVSVGKGNDSIACDWASIGFINIAGA